MIAIIDYGAGNLRSVEKALTAIGEESITLSAFKISCLSLVTILSSPIAVRAFWRCNGFA